MARGANSSGPQQVHGVCMDGERGGGRGGGGVLVCSNWDDTVFVRLSGCVERTWQRDVFLHLGSMQTGI